MHHQETIPFQMYENITVQDRIDYKLIAEKIFPPGVSVITGSTWKERINEVWSMIQKEKGHFRFSQMFTECDRIANELIRQGLVKKIDGLFIRIYQGGAT